MLGLWYVIKLTSHFGRKAKPNDDTTGAAHEQEPVKVEDPNETEGQKEITIRRNQTFVPEYATTR